MQKSCRVGFMYGELTDKNTIDAIDEALETHQTEQFEILLYKKNRKTIIIIPLLSRVATRVFNVRLLHAFTFSK